MEKLKKQKILDLRGLKLLDLTPYCHDTLLTDIAASGNDFVYLPTGTSSFI